jgi:hypothetical protein
MIGEAADPRLWRPQTFGGRNHRAIADPIIEPLWSGLRLLADISRDGVELWGAVPATAPPDRPGLEAALVEAAHADRVILDGYLTAQAARSGVGVFSGAAADLPTPADIARQMVVGQRNRRKELLEALDEHSETMRAPGDDAVFVAVDLLLIDGEPLLDVPLLERKRLLDGTVVESSLVRIGIHVRPPVDPWLGTWRNLGFHTLAYKESNGRYRPGEANPGWASARIPKT